MKKILSAKWSSCATPAALVHVPNGAHHHFCQWKNPRKLAPSSQCSVGSPLQRIGQSSPLGPFRTCCPNHFPNSTVPLINMGLVYRTPWTIKLWMFGILTSIFSLQTCLQSGGKEGLQLLNTIFTVYQQILKASEQWILWKIHKFCTLYYSYNNLPQFWQWYF